jgi:predicted ATPase
MPTAYRQDILETYPQPLAATYARFVEQRDPASQHAVLLVLFEALLKYLAAVAASQHLRLGGQDPDVQAALDHLRRPSLGHWAALLRASVAWWSKQPQPEFVFPELLPLYSRPADLPAAVALRHRLQGGAATKVALGPLFDALVTHRNEWAHGAGPSGGAYAALVPLLQAALEEVLGALPSLAGTPLEYLEGISLRRGGRHVLSMVPLMGAHPLLRPRRDEPPSAEPPMDPEQIYLLPPASRAGAVPLHPLLVFVPECPVCRTHQVAVLNELTTRAAEYLCYGCGHAVPLQEPVADLAALLVADGAAPSLEPAPAQAGEDTAGPVGANNLPLAATPLVGREREVAAVCERLLRPDVRLLTLTGPGGIGKTRLALAAATELAREFPGGVFFVPLAPLADPGLVVPTIAYTLGLREAGEQPIAETLQEYIEDKTLLLLLDSFEHLLEAAAAVAALLKAAPDVQVLVTSRAALHLSLEHEYPVPALAVPDPRQLPVAEDLAQYAAVALFIQRAQAVKPDFQINAQNARAVAEICVRLEGIPLALVLAAARVKALPPPALLAKLGSRLQLLTGGSRDLDIRQQTLRNTIGWSYDLLTAEEQQLFRRMAVFRGGWTLAAAAAVCNVDRAASTVAEPAFDLAVLDGITSLVDKSLMYTTENGSGEPRYGMLETIREYAWEQLGESGEAAVLQKAHALYFLDLAERTEPELTGGQQAEGLACLEEEHDNIRAVLRWARDQAAHSGGPVAGGADSAAGAEGLAIGLRLAGAIRRFWSVRGYFGEGREQLAALLELDAAATAQAARGDPTAAAARDALRPHRARVLDGAGVLALLQGDYGAARALLERGLALFRELGDSAGSAASLGNLGDVARGQGDYTTARALYTESLALFRQLGDNWGIASALGHLGVVARVQGDYDAARALNEQSLALQRELGDKQGVAYSLGNLGIVAQEQGDYTAARALHEESLALRRELGDKRGITLSLGNLGIVAQLQRDYAAARALLEESLALRRELGDKRGIAMSLGSLGLVAQEQGDYAAARALLEESLILRRELGDKWGIALALAGLGAVAVESATRGSSTEPGAAERGVRLLGAVAVLLENISALLDTNDRLPYARAIAAARARLGDEVFQRAWEAGRAMTPEQAIAYALGQAPA